MFPAWQSVKANIGHLRGGDEKGEGGQAGVSQGLGEKKDTTKVRWDVDGVIEDVKNSQLQALI